MRKIKIIADSTCDLSQNLIEKYDITIIPLSVIIGGKSYLDGVEINAIEMFELIEATGHMPTTSAPSPETFINVFQKYIDEDMDIIFFSLPQTMSATLNVATIAADLIAGAKERIHLIDTLNLCSGSGLLVVKTAQLRDEGKTLSEIIEAVHDMIPRIHTSFVVETIDYLHRGGRMSSAKYILGKAFKAHPIIKMTDGVLDSAALPKGKMKKALDVHLKQFHQDYANGIDESLFMITSAGNKGDKYADYYFKEISKFIPAENIIFQKAGCVISSHCGDGTSAFMYLKNK